MKPAPPADGCRLIPLTQGRHAVVDERDFERLSKHKWCFHRQSGYAVRGTRANGANRPVYMHRDILDCPEGVQVRHGDDDKLNNRRGNLRLAKSLNGKRRKGSSRFKGVRLRKGRWVARITVDYVSTHLGSFDDEVEAARAYNEAALAHFGDLADLNNLDDNKEKATS